jgi:type IV pilus assembly protein PilC
MPRFVWKGIDAKGNDRKGTLEALSKENLQQKLLAQEIALLEAREERFFFPKHLLFGGRLQLKEELAVFFGNLSLLLERGIPLISVLEIAAVYIEHSMLKKALESITREIRDGLSFSRALEKHTTLFGSFVVPLIQAGERSGKLQEVSTYIARHFGSSVRVSRCLRSAALLPGITLLFALVLVIGLFVGIIPQFEILFSSMHSNLPDATKLILHLQGYFTFFNFAIFGFVVLMGVLALKHIFSITTFRLWWDKWILSLLVIGRIISLINMVHFVQILSLLLLSGVPLKDGLECASGVVGNLFLKKRIANCAERISKGESLEVALRAEGEEYFPEQLLTVVSVGEKSGRLGEMLEQAASFFRESLNVRTKTLITLFQPALLIFVGLLIGFIMLAIYMPIFDLAYISH